MKEKETKKVPVTAAKTEANVQVKAAEEKIEVKKTEVKPAEVKKPTEAKKTAVKKPAAKKAEVKANVTLQFDGKSFTQAELIKIAKDVWKYDHKKKVSDLKSIDLYVKPEESICYYVINGDVAGSFSL